MARHMGLIADIMRRTRAQYHYAIKHCHNNYNDIRNKPMAEAISSNNQRNLWNEVRSLNKSNKRMSSIIDGEKGDDNIVPIL